MNIIFFFVKIHMTWRLSHLIPSLSFIIILCFFREFKVEYFMQCTHLTFLDFWRNFQEIFLLREFVWTVWKGKHEKKKEEFNFSVKLMKLFYIVQLTKFHKCHSVEKQEIILRLKILSWKQLLLNKDVDFTEDLLKKILLLHTVFDI